LLNYRLAARGFRNPPSRLVAGSILPRRAFFPDEIEATFFVRTLLN